MSLGTPVFPTIIRVLCDSGFIYPRLESGQEGKNGR
jgi:hypothetical protein